MADSTDEMFDDGQPTTRRGAREQTRWRRHRAAAVHSGRQRAAAAGSANQAGVWQHVSLFSRQKFAFAKQRLQTYNNRNRITLHY